MGPRAPALPRFAYATMRTQGSQEGRPQIRYGTRPLVARRRHGGAANSASNDAAGKELAGVPRCARQIYGRLPAIMAEEERAGACPTRAGLAVRPVQPSIASFLPNAPESINMAYEYTCETEDYHKYAPMTPRSQRPSGTPCTPS